MCQDIHSTTRCKIDEFMMNAENVIMISSCFDAPRHGIHDAHDEADPRLYFHKKIYIMTIVR